MVRLGGLSLGRPAVVTLSHGLARLWKRGSWPLPLKCQVRDWGWRRMAVGVCGAEGEEGMGGRGQGVRNL